MSLVHTYIFVWLYILNLNLYILYRELFLKTILHLYLGVCECYAGWTGPNCTSPCPEGFFGAGCSLHCKCQNNGKCRSIDGACKCPPGYSGTHCTESKLYISIVLT